MPEPTHKTQPSTDAQDASPRTESPYPPTATRDSDTRRRTRTHTLLHSQVSTRHARRPLLYGIYMSLGLSHTPCPWTGSSMARSHCCLLTVPPGPGPGPGRVSLSRRSVSPAPTLSFIAPTTRDRELPLYAAHSRGEVSSLSQSQPYRVDDGARLVDVHTRLVSALCCTARRVCAACRFEARQFSLAAFHVLQRTGIERRGIV
jgi:hypothetical protein